MDENSAHTPQLIAAAEMLTYLSRLQMQPLVQLSAKFPTTSWGSIPLQPRNVIGHQWLQRKIILNKILDQGADK